MRTRNAIDQSIRISLAFEQPFSLDMVVRTPWQIERGLNDDNWFVREIIEKGKVLYEARDRQVRDSTTGREPAPIVEFVLNQPPQNEAVESALRKEVRFSKCSWRKLSDRSIVGIVLDTAQLASDRCLQFSIDIPDFSCSFAAECPRNEVCGGFLAIWHF
jgi:hypothetical protein